MIDNGFVTWNGYQEELGAMAALKNQASDEKGRHSALSAHHLHQKTDLSTGKPKKTGISKKQVQSEQQTQEEEQFWSHSTNSNDFHNSRRKIDSQRKKITLSSSPTGDDVEKVTRCVDSAIVATSSQCRYDQANTWTTKEAHQDVD
ncbi:hypothetical protein CAEBREN_12426 [Caenorhabditis brenneri]|uniref:Uncharacterized protein n=1 Tax=Caenorhabditis brenneri TaxID=135651 RepID=G0NJ40_CAEBE|nr:hypothetical protein CAEBREN_12426 [Caenorhabditis brenneri]